jgi:hypothetical protein
MTAPGSSTAGFDNIDTAFNRIRGMFGPAVNPAGGGGTGNYGLMPQPVGAGDNDLTRYQRSLTNLLGGTGPGLLQTGQGLLGGGVDITQGGLDVTKTGLQTLDVPLDFYKKLLAGDPSATTSALAPTAANIAQITAGATDQAARGLPGGGYRAATMAGLPFAQAAQLGNAALALQPMAAKEIAGIGGEQAQIGKGISETGLDLGKLSTILTQFGLGALQNTIEDVLRKAGINVQETGNILSAII